MAKINMGFVTSLAQIVLSVVYIAGYFYLLDKFLDGQVKTPVEWRDQLGILIGVLTAGVGMILNFWFQRVREQFSPPNDNP